MTQETNDNQMPYVMYRMPDERLGMSLSCGKLSRFGSLDEIGPDRSGFIVAPFKATANNPIFLYEDIEAAPVDPFRMPKGDADNPSIRFSADRGGYAKSFGIVKEALDSGRCQKLVLARSVTASSVRVDVRHLFVRACVTYPHCYIALFCVPGRGAWLTATPELLYRQQGDDAGTKALAGTMTWHDHEHGAPWSDKNRREQQLVTDYITQNLAKQHIAFEAGKAHTIKAGHLAHLCTDIRVPHARDLDPVDMLGILHPTPAVAGIPLDEALRVIGRSEGENFRGYYAGFCGLLRYGNDKPGEAALTHCYVSLRLFHLAPDERLTLYAGGGILRESDEESEWNETELKLQTIRKIMNENNERMNE